MCPQKPDAARAYKHAPKNLTVRDFLRWLNKVDRSTPEYWDGLFSRAEAIGAGDLPTTRRSLLERFITADINHDDELKKEILAEYKREEKKLLTAVASVFRTQIKRMQAMGDPVLIIEPGCGPGRFTRPFMPITFANKWHYFAFDGSSTAIHRNRKNLEQSGVLRWKESENWVTVGDARSLTHLLEGRVAANSRVMILLIRLTLHFVHNPIRRKFMKETRELVRKHGGIILHAETTADLLPPGRVALPGTVFRTGEEVDEEVGTKPYQAPKIVQHHGDPIRIADYDFRV